MDRCNRLRTKRTLHDPTIDVNSHQRAVGYTVDQIGQQKREHLVQEGRSIGSVSAPVYRVISVTVVTTNVINPQQRAVGYGVACDPHQLGSRHVEATSECTPAKLAKGTISKIRGGVGNCRGANPNSPDNGPNVITETLVALWAKLASTRKRLARAPDPLDRCNRRCIKRTLHDPYTYNVGQCDLQ